LIFFILILMNLERTFREAVGTTRWRIKFVIIGLGVLFVVRSYTECQALLFRAMELRLEAVNFAALLLACALISRSLLRAGHFDVNLHPSNSLLRNSITALLAGIYLLILGLSANATAHYGSDVDFAIKAFVILVLLVLLAVLLLSDRVRLWMRQLVSRHLQRPLHDYRSVWTSFTRCTASQVQGPEFCEAVVKLVSDLFQTLSVTVWLADEKQEKLVFTA